MITGYKGPGEIEAEVLMTRQVHSGGFLLVEGADDSRFWTARVTQDATEIVIADGKPNLEQAMARLDRRGFRGALGVVDDDFDTLEGRPLPSLNLAATDGHDLECLLLASSALERVLAEYGDPSRLRRFESSSRQTVREGLLARGLPFGRLRWLAKRSALPLDFRKLKPERFVTREEWRLDEEGLLQATAAQGAAADTAALRAALAALPPADPWQLCQGHDLVEILRIGLQKTLGRLKPSIGADGVATALRLAFDDDLLRSTRLHRRIRSWEERHGHHYGILR